jgi:hypothetical protein
MDASEILEQLETLAEHHRIKVRYEKCKSRGGLCRVNDEQMLIVRRSLTVPEKVDVLSQALAALPLDDVYLKPEVRRLLEEAALRLRGDESDTPSSQAVNPD